MFRLHFSIFLQEWCWFRNKTFTKARMWTPISRRYSNHKLHDLTKNVEGNPEPFYYNSLHHFCYHLHSQAISKYPTVGSNILTIHVFSLHPKEIQIQAPAWWLTVSAICAHSLVGFFFLESLKRSVQIASSCLTAARALKQVIKFCDEEEKKKKEKTSWKFFEYPL